MPNDAHDETSRSHTFFGGACFGHEVFRDHTLIDSKGVTVGLENVVTGSDAESMWEMYQRGFMALNASVLSRQSLDKEEFKEELEDSTVMKYMARNRSGAPIGYMAVEKGLFRTDASPYWNQQDDNLLSKLQSEIDPDAPSFYIASFLVDKDTDEYMLKASKIILQGALRHFREVCLALGAKALCFYDFAPANHYLPDYITECGHPDGPFEGVEIETWPVYVKEWYLLPASALTPQWIEDAQRIIPEDAFAELDGRLTVEAGIPLEIQPENLEHSPADYCTITNLPWLLSDPESAAEMLLGPDSPIQQQQHVLVALRRLGAVQPPVPNLGQRLSHQNYVAQQLVD